MQIAASRSSYVQRGSEENKMEKKQIQGRTRVAGHVWLADTDAAFFVERRRVWFGDWWIERSE